MKLSYRAQGTGDYTAFGDDDGGDLIMGFEPRMQAVAQVTPLFRASNQLVSARNNRVWTVEGMVEKEHATADAAVAWMQEQAAAIPDFVDVKIEEGATALVLTPAVMVGFEPQVRGCSTTIRYSFVGADLAAAGE